jgi:hypothetical protein
MVLGGDPPQVWLVVAVKGQDGPQEGICQPWANDLVGQPVFQPRPPFVPDLFAGGAAGDMFNRFLVQASVASR